MKLNRAREADGSSSQPFDPCSQRQVVALNTLSKEFADRMPLFRKLSGIAAPFISGQPVLADFVADKAPLLVEFADKCDVSMMSHRR